MGRKNSSNISNPLSLKSKTGFTLIELTTVIGVLGVLSAIVLAVLNPLEQFNKSQDARRKGDLAQIQRGLEVYYNDFQKYPPVYQAPNINRISTDGTSSTAVAWGSDWRPYMDILPLDPKVAKSYAYWADAAGQSYVLFAALDRGSKDPQACNGGSACARTVGTGIGGTNITCGTNISCTYGVSSPNISP